MKKSKKSVTDTLFRATHRLKIRNRAKKGCLSPIFPIFSGATNPT
jgi:hypothetical protein